MASAVPLDLHVLSDNLRLPLHPRAPSAKIHPIHGTNPSNLPYLQAYWKGKACSRPRRLWSTVQVPRLLLPLVFLTTASIAQTPPAQNTVQSSPTATPQAGPASSQTSKPTVTPSTPTPATAPGSPKVPLLVQPLRLADFLADPENMGPSPALSDHLAHITSFTQRSPLDGQPPSEPTQVYIARTASTLYFVFLCRDTRPAEIRSHLARRENVLTDDNVSVLLDPFQDHRRGILFQTNPQGVQADAAYTENSGNDYSYDQVWDSEARITHTGWAALIAIPFRSLRFRTGSNAWGVVFYRNIPRNSETDTWPRIAQNVAGTLTQEGTLLDVEGGTGSHNIQLNPYGLVQNEHTLNSLDPAAPYFSSRAFEGTAGGDAKIILKDKIVIDATINPDFSQVESNQPQFTVNQRYPVYFPELRPFFLENANYFATPINLLYTRNIVHPEFGVRVTGKVGRTNLGILAIDDRNPGELFQPGDALYGKHSTFAVARVSQDLGKGSSIGAIYTDQEFAGSSNRIGGLDYTARFSDHWTGLGQFVESSTRPLIPPGTVSSARYSAGPASTLEFTRSGHSFNLDNTYLDVSTGFQTQVGFLQTADIRSDSNNANYHWYPKKGRVQLYGLETTVGYTWDHQGNRVHYNHQFDVFAAFARNLVFAPLFVFNSDTLTPAEYSALPFNRNYAENAVGGIAKGAPMPQINYNIVYLQSGNVNYNPPASTGAPFLLHQNYLQALVTLQPIHALTIDNTYLLDRDRAVHPATPNAPLAFENQTLRTKLNYQFTRAFSARVIVEYDSTLADPAQTSLVRSKTVSSSALLTWLPHPGTAIYLGYNNNLDNYDHTLCTRGPGTQCNPNSPILPRGTQYLNDGRQIFLKASYLLRF